MENQDGGVRILLSDCCFFIQFITSVQSHTYIRFLMKNLIRSKEEQIRKQETETARKTHEIASLE